MNFTDFSDILQKSPHAVVLLEGMRALPEMDREKLTTIARQLAEKFPSAIFRTGNAAGTDEAFARGVAAVDSGRLQYILPYAGHRKKNLCKGSRSISLTEIPEAEDGALISSLQSSPDYRSLMEKRKVVPRLGAMANYILRDTVKVIGAPGQGFAPAAMGLFYANPDDPMVGGTGHTLRVCRKHNVPVALQSDWLGWLEKM